MGRGNENKSTNLVIMNITIKTKQSIQENFEKVERGTFDEKSIKELLIDIGELCDDNHSFLREVCDF